MKDLHGCIIPYMDGSLTGADNGPEGWKWGKPAGRYSSVCVLDLCVVAWRMGWIGRKLDQSWVVQS
jgi:hypothetical protein